MKCSSECKFLCLNKLTGKLECSRTGWIISDLPQNIKDNCPKFVDKSYVRHDILKSRY
jgi:hypothetical protein